jgi:sulfite exporter TauE/SafE
MNLLLIFLTGLTTGGLSCLAMQGGLLASVIANQKGEELKSQPNLQPKRVSFAFDQMEWKPVLMFLTTKLISHTILGLLLGLLGSAISLSLQLRLAFQIFTALFMFATAMNLLNAHPIFRYVVFQPPKFMQRWVRSTSKSKSLFAPGLLGVLTIFIPCGVTQAMEVVAINSGNPIYGALIMFSFVLGTSPLFALVGALTAKLSEGWYQRFSRFAACVLVLMALYSINGVLLVVDSPIALHLPTPMGQSVATTATENGVQKVTINVHNNGYQPNFIRVNKGQEVELTLQSDKTYSCALAFVFKEFGINTFLEATDTQVFTFTPEKTGRYTFSCSMGMYTGTMEVI